MRVSILGALCLAWGVVDASAQATLLDVVEQGRVDAVQALVAEGADVNAAAADGTTALLVAINQDDAAVARVLLDAGASATLANRYGVTPLALAARNGNARLIEAVVQAGADPNAGSPEGETPLMTAIKSARVDAVTTLLRLGANPNAQESWHGQTALMWAAAENLPEIVGALIESGADINAHGKVLPGQPPRPRNSETSFQAAHSNFPKGGFTPLLFAAQYGSGDAVAVLAAAGADLEASDPDGITPLMMAIVNAHFDVAAKLVEAGANVNAADKSGRSPLFFSADMNTLEWLFSRPNPVPSGEMDAVDMAKFLLDHGADPNARLTARGFQLHHNSTGNSSLGAGATPFMKAATTSDVTLMRMFLEYGADPHLLTDNYTTPLMAAAGLNWVDIASRGTEEASLEAIELLLEHGADVNAFNELGETALHGAAERGADRIVRFLADQGAILDAQNRRGRTPMDEAIGQADVSDGASVRRPERKGTQALLRQLLDERAVARAGQ